MSESEDGASLLDLRSLRLNAEGSKGLMTVPLSPLLSVIFGGFHVWVGCVPEGLSSRDSESGVERSSNQTEGSCVLVICSRMVSPGSLFSLMMSVSRSSGSMIL